ncbi:tRNA (adenosine(37)-N6)-threonylcarbamoyltransferase complex dimerization subunit type 1 TsaB [Candidatus Gottesmanbacteria bacterium]|nr:tRNA (adenosine(37)-N6)-threonylcarbamoyltransferase complex dimerization subunit type 1 TsaB [Candidatus Gottesmanbacteria bacterium]
MKQNIILFINTSNQDTAKVSLEIDGKRYEKTSQSRVMKAQMVLPLIEELLKEHQMKPSDITEICVHVGPGSFTGLRVGMAVANMMGKLLNIPVNGKHLPVVPRYDRDW